MIEDVFLKRYRRQRLFHGDKVHPAVSQVLCQAAQIFAREVGEHLNYTEQLFQRAAEQLVMELGYNSFPHDDSVVRSCLLFLTETHDVWNSRHSNVDTFVKERLSLIELLFRFTERKLSEPRAAEFLTRRRLFGPRIEPGEILVPAISHLNTRFREAGVSLHYHNGLLQFATDDLSQQRIAEPFWQLTSDPVWANVDQDMKEAVHRADAGGRDAAFYATRALESTIKIISDTKGWSTRNEKGASNYIDNLVSSRNGRFIEVWEMEALKAIFTHIRNPHGHGSGSQPQAVLTEHQTQWVIETCMSWIKSLIRRL